MNGFAARLETRIAAHGPLCVGIDPSAKLLASCGLPDSAEGALELGFRILAAADYALAVIKPQSAYFERYGSAGIRALEELIARARAKEVPVLLDVKRGDIDTTGSAYAQAYFAPASSLRADAITLNPYLGLGALEQAVTFAAEQGGGVFVVVRSSNAEGEALQTARRADGRTVAGALCEEITALNRRLGGQGLGPVGAVVGATCLDADETTAALPASFILAPGVGAQGATIADVRARMPRARGRVLPNVSRAIFAGGVSAEALRAAIDELKRQSRKLQDSAP